MINTSSLNKFALNKWLLKQILKDYFVIVYCLVIAPLFACFLFVLFSENYRSYYSGGDTAIFWKSSFIAVANFFILAPLCLVIFPMIINALRKSSFFFKIKIWNLHNKVFIRLYLYFCIINIISLIWTFFIITLSNFNFFYMGEAHGNNIDINYLGYVVGLFVGSLFLAIFPLIISVFTKSPIAAAVIGSILLIVYILDSAVAKSYFQFVDSYPLKIASFFSPFTYANGLTQLSILKIDYSDGGLTNGDIFNPFNNLVFAWGEGGFQTFFYVYDIWLLWIIPLILIVVGLIVVFWMINNKMKNLWLSN